MLSRMSSHFGSEFRAAVEAENHDAMVACLSPNVVFHSPVTFKPFEGRDAVAHLFGVLLKVFEDFTYTDHLTGDRTAILLFRARVGDKQVEGADILRYGNDGLIDDFTVMVRPLSAAMALGEAVGKGLGLTTGS